MPEQIFISWSGVPHSHKNDYLLQYGLLLELEQLRFCFAHFRYAEFDSGVQEDPELYAHPNDVPSLQAHELATHYTQSSVPPRSVGYGAS